MSHPGGDREVDTCPVHAAEDRAPGQSDADWKVIGSVVKWMLDYPHAHLTAADRMVLNQWLPFMMEAAKEAERLRQDAGFYHAGTHALSAENYRLRARVEELEAALEHVMAECEDAHAGAGDKWDEHTTRLFSDTLMAIRRDAEEALAHARKEKWAKNHPHERRFNFSSRPVTA